MSDFISLSDASHLTGLSPQTLKLQAQRGRLSAHKVGNVWVTTTAALMRYISSRRKNANDVQVICRSCELVFLLPSEAAKSDLGPVRGVYVCPRCASPGLVPAGGAPQGAGEPMGRLDPDDSWRDSGFRGGQVTRAFDDWRLEAGYLQAFLRLGLEFSREAYQRRWDEIAHQPSDDEGPDMFDLMDEAVDGLTPHQYEQIHLASVVRDGMTIFEMYFERAFAEVLQAHVTQRVTLPENSPRWNHLRDAWKTLVGFEIESAAVADIRNRRHWLTHQRGELRTQLQRAEFDTLEFGFPDERLRLTQAAVIADLEALQEVIQDADTAAHARSWGSTRACDADVVTALGQVQSDFFGSP